MGLALFALLHGGGAFLDVPPVRALLGIGGSVRLGLPITSFALVPFLLSLLAGRLSTQEEMDQGIALNGGSLLQ